jgi:hypothetical protein
MTPAERVLARAIRVDGCLVFIGARTRFGYGRLHVGGRVEHTHRVTWEAARGSIPDGLIVCHHCDNPPCVDVDHLFLGTHRDNVADMVAKGRASRLIGEQSAKATLTNAQVREMRELSATLTQRELAERFDVEAGYVSVVVRGKRRPHDLDAVQGARATAVRRIDIAQAKALYAQGGTVLGLAKRMGVDSGALWRALTRAGVEIRKTPSPNRRCVDEDAIERLHLNDVPATRIAAQVGTTAAIVHRVIRERGLERRPCGRPAAHGHTTAMPAMGLLRSAWGTR